MDATVDPPRTAVKNPRLAPGPGGRSTTFTFALPGAAALGLLGLLALPSFAGLAPSAAAADRLLGAPTTRTSPSLERQLDRARRDPSGANSLERRQLQDQLRQEPPGAERTRRQNALEQLPPAPRATGSAPLPPPLTRDRLPSSIPPPENGLPTSLPPFPLSRPAIPRSTAPEAAAP